MALQVWLPLNKDGAVKNQGLANVNITSTATYNASGKLGGSYYFSGSSNRISFPSQPWMAPNDTNSISIAMWVKAGSFNCIIACNAFEYNLSSSSFMWRLGDGNTNTFATVTSGITFTTGTWYHLCGTWDAKNKKLAAYVNGELVKELTSTLTSYNNISSTINLVYNGSWNINDFRFYDHCLSPKEVKEIAKGLVLHYPLNDAYLEETSNLFTYPTPGSSCTNSYGWDKTLHKDAISVPGWSPGYNSSVDNPSTVYHAHWIMMDGLPTMRFPYITNSSGQTPGWLGISGYGLQTSNFAPGIKYTVSFDAKADENNSAISCGLYYKRNSSDSRNFYDGKPNTTLTTDWKRYSVTYTSQGAYEISSFYFYGVCGGPKGNRYIRNVQLEINDHATPYTPNTRNETTVHDCSGYQNNGNVEEFKAAGNNLVTGLTAGGQTTVSGETVTTSGVNADTWFTINLSESIVVGQTYTLSCIGKNIPTDGYFGFPLGWQGNTSLMFNIKNGYNEITFTANDGSWGTNSLFMGDYGRATAYMNKCEFTGFKLYKHRTSNSGINEVCDSTRNKVRAKINGKNTIWLSSPLGSGAKEELTVSFWHKPNSQGNYRTIVSNNYPHSGFWIGCNCEGHGLWYYGGSFYVQSQSFLSNDTWYHCALTYKNQTYQWYLNGVPVTTSISGTFKAPTFSSPISIGGNTSGDMKGSISDYRQYGALSDFRIYSTALSADDIKELYDVSCIINS